MVIDARFLAYAVIFILIIFLPQKTQFLGPTVVAVNERAIILKLILDLKLDMLRPLSRPIWMGELAAAGDL